MRGGEWPEGGCMGDDVDDGLDGGDLEEEGGALREIGGDLDEEGGPLREIGFRRGGRSDLDEEGGALREIGGGGGGTGHGTGTRTPGPGTGEGRLPSGVAGSVRPEEEPRMCGRAGSWDEWSTRPPMKVPSLVEAHW